MNDIYKWLQSSVHVVWTLLMCLVLMSTSATGQSKIALFYDPAYVDIAGTCNNEAWNLYIYYTNAGHTVTTFQGTTGGTWVPALMDKDALVIPEQEISQLMIDGAAKHALINFVNSGKVLIIHGSAVGRTEAFLNDVFGFSLAFGGFLADGTSIPADAANLAASCLAGAADPITAHTNTWSSWLTPISTPPNTLNIYPYPGDPMRSIIYQIDYGFGKIIYVGWDYWEGGPTCMVSDPQWDDIFERALACSIPCAAAPQVEACPDTIKVANDVDLCGAYVNYTIVFDNPCGDEVIEHSLDMGMTWNPGTGSGSFFGIDTVEVWVRSTNANGSDTCKFFVAVFDAQRPEAHCTNVNAVVSDGCDATVYAHQFGFLSHDNCDTAFTEISRDGVAFSTSLTFTVADVPGPHQIFMRVCDIYGNCDTCAALLYLSDTSNPTITCPAGLTIPTEHNQCYGKVPDITVTITDNCDALTVEQQPPAGTLFGSSHGDNFDVKIIVEDKHGNKDTCITTLTLDDIQAPTIACPANTTIGTSMGGTGDCQGNLEWVHPLPMDNCNIQQLDLTITPPMGAPVVFVGVTPGTQMNYDFDIGTSTLTYEATDDAGNVANCTWTVTVVDDEAPQVTCPADMTFNTSDGGTGDCEGEASWDHPIPTDNCAVDSMNLVLMLPGNVVLEFPNVTPGAAFTQSLPKGTTVGKYIVWDTTGNSITCMFNITIVDDEDPLIVCPPDQTLTTTAPFCWHVVLGTYLDPTVSDNCPGVTWTHNYPLAPHTNTLVGASFVVGTHTITWTATDSAGNVSQCTFTITVEDNDPPIISNCPDSTLTFANDPGLCGVYPNLPQIVAVDNCVGFNVTYRYSLDEGATWHPGQAYNLFYPVGTTHVWYVAEDTSGNVSDTCKFVIEVLDTEHPHAVCTDVNVTVGDTCKGFVTAEQVGFLSYDNCDSLTLKIGLDTTTLVDTLMFTDADLPGPITVYLQACDTSGNCSWCTATIHLVDTTSPMIVCPSDMTINTEPGQCHGKIPDLAAVAFSDSCGVLTITQVPSPGLLFGSHHGDSIIVHLIIEDQMGNTDTCDVKLTLNDNEPPFIVCPLDVTIPTSSDGTGDCNGSYTWNHPVPTDNCHIDSLNLEIQDPDGTITMMFDLPLGGVITRQFMHGTTKLKYTAIDSAGNMVMCLWRVTVVDDEPPVVTCPPDQTLQCGDTVPAGATTIDDFIALGGTVTDNCSDTFTVTYVDFSNGLSHCTFDSPLVVQRMYIITDTSGNSATCIQQFIFEEDTIPPTISGVPMGDTTVACSEDIPPLPSVTAMDNCDRNNVILVYSESRANDTCHDKFTLIRQWIAFDVCGNADTASYAIHVRDTIPPELHNIPADTTVLCQEDLPPVPTDVFATDNCNQLITVSFHETIVPLGCDDQFDIVRTWVATDACGNTVDSSYRIMVRDTLPPVITGGSDYVILCDQSNANNDDELISWLNNHAGATATDNCSRVTWSNNYSDTNWVSGCGDSRYIDVTFYAEDECGNVDSVTFRFGTLDTVPPTFLNCPRLPIVENAEFGHCDAYVNFAPLIAVDNCSDSIIIRQIDTTGLSSGDRFPVGTTVLLFEAVDACGNADTCSIKVIVNDYWETPTITCPFDIDTFDNDPDKCGAEVYGLKPTAEDNCPSNLSILYMIKDSSGAIIKEGVEDASGEFFPVGADTLTYIVQDQPLLLITEVTQELGAPVGATNPVPPYFDGDLAKGDYVEITNFGPAAIDINCLTLEIVDDTGTACLATMPISFILPVGQTIVAHVGTGANDPANFYFSLNCPEVDNTTPRTYILSLYDHVIDVVTTNGMDPVGLGTTAVVEADDWSGTSANLDCYGSYYRHSIIDDNDPSDWTLASSCDPATLGSLNPNLPVMTDNGALLTLQSTDPGKDSCTMIIVVRDVEVPTCVEYDTTIYDGATNLGVDINQGDCYVSTINVPTNGLIGDINVLNVQGTSDDVNGLEVKLISPSGTEVILFSGVCAPGDDDFDASFDDTSSITSPSCNPYGGGEIIQPQEALKAFYLENMQGTWTLEIANNTCDSNAGPTVLNNWMLQIMKIDPYSQGDTVIANDPDQCGAKFMWTHPILEDNCCRGEIFVKYLTDDPINVPDPGYVEGGTTTMEFFEVGKTTVLYILTDAAGNQSSCSFMVTVVDTQKPVITNCPGDFIVQADPGECEVHWSYIINAEDNCGVDTIIYSPQNDTFLPIGEHTICVVAIDSAGNTDTCKYKVTVKEFEPATSELACNNQIQLSLDTNCQAVITADMILEGNNYHCYEDYVITAREGCGDTTSPPRPAVFDIDDVGKCFTIMVSDPQTGNSCWGCVCIEDKLAPEIACPPDTVIPCAQSFDPSVTGRPTLLTCARSPIFNYHDDIIENDRCDSFRVVIKRKWIVTDESGQSDTCTQYIYIKSFDLDDIVFPPDFDDISNPALLCDERFDSILDAKIDPRQQFIRPGVENPHFPPHAIDPNTGCAIGCVDDYLLDTLIYQASGCRIRVPRALGWNVIKEGPYAGHPSPFTEFYPSHWQWVRTRGRRCFGGFPVTDPNAPSPYAKWIGTGVPTIGGKSIYDNHRYCNYTFRWEDEVYESCCGELEIHRHWKVVNKCLPLIPGINPREHIQVIRVLDKKGPTITFPDEVTVGMRSNSCFGYWLVPEPWLEDNCCPDITYRVLTWTGTAAQLPSGQWIVFGLEEGMHTVIIEAEDGCNNVTRHEVKVTVVDDIPPVPVCQGHKVVSLTTPLGSNNAFVTVSASEFDDGSFDNCKSVWFKVIRMEELLGTPNGSTRDNRVACGGANGDDDIRRSGNQVYFDDYTGFCCEDVGNTITVVVRVFDVDPGPGPVSPARMDRGDLKGHFTDCMVTVEVQNKSVPLVVAPDDVVVSCSFWFDDSEEALSDPNNPTFGRIVTDQNQRQKIKTTDIVCPRWCEDIQTHYLTWQPSLGIPAISTLACQYATDLYNDAHPDQRYDLVWGWDGLVTGACGVQPVIRVTDNRQCGQGLITRTIEVTLNGQTYRDQQNIWVVGCDQFYIDPVNCTSTTDDIEWPNGCRETIELDGCGADLDPSNPLLGKPELVPGVDDQCNNIAITHDDDTIYVVPDACFKVIRDWRVIDWCQWDPDVDLQYGYSHPHPGEWHFRQIIIVRDQNAPEVSCSAGDCEPLTYTDTVINGQRYCIGHINLTVSANDDCTPDELLTYDYKIDLFNDGTGKYGTYDVYVGKAKAGEEAADFDNPWADNEKDPTNASGVYPEGEHMIQWFVEDGCGNVGVCTMVFEVRDCKAPTPNCETGLITAVMPASGEVTIWANNFDLKSTDNCTDSTNLKFYFNGDPNMLGYTVTCDTFRAHNAVGEVQLNVQVWVEDEAGNTDFCEVVLIVQDNVGVCDTGSTILHGTVTNYADERIENHLVRLLDAQNQVVRIIEADGEFDVRIPQTAEKIDIFKNNKWLNGVSTRDLIAIHNHVLDRKPFNQAWQFIAADASNDEYISVRDIQILRSLVLGKIRNLDRWNQTSWVFLPKDWTFDNIREPWDYPTTLDIQSLIEAQKNADFFGIKIGDVTGDAKPNLATSSQTREVATLNFYAEAVTANAGDEVSIPIYGEKFDGIMGFQFTFQYDPDQLEIVSLQPGALPITTDHYAILSNEGGITTVSWNDPTAKGVSVSNDQVLFYIVANAKRDIRGIPELYIGSAVTPSEAYDSHDRLYQVQLRWKDTNGTTAKRYHLYQNTPNPVSTSTEIAFELPQDMPVKLTFYKENGKVLKVIFLDGEEGFNQVMIHARDLQADGSIYYQLDAKDYTSTRKMILIK